MTLSTSRQQFLASELNETERLQYGRRRGHFVSRPVCFGFIFSAFALAALVGVAVYFFSWTKLNAGKDVDFWDLEEPTISPLSKRNLRLPKYVIPQYYRIRLKPFIENSTFEGEVSITLRASNNHVNKIMLHMKNIILNEDKTLLTQQTYANVSSAFKRVRRDADKESRDVFKPKSKLLDKEVEEKANVTEITTPKTSEKYDNEEITTTESPKSFINNSKQTRKSSSETTTKETPLVTTTMPSLVETTTKASTVKTTTSSSTVNSDKDKKKSIVPDIVMHSQTKNVKIVSKYYDAQHDKLIFTLESQLVKGVDYILQLTFKGNLTDSLTGFYKSSYRDSLNKTKTLATTQFEPTSARMAFPCFDEPEFKAKFEISIAQPPNMTVLSNMPVLSREDDEKNLGWKWVHFERSVNMSTYLVAYVVSEFESINSTYKSQDKKTKDVKIWAQPSLIKNAKYAAKIAPVLLEFYEQYFGIPYALDKLDLVAVPDFSAGAMENWGLITFRESSLLLHEGANVPKDKLNVAVDVSHELAHQWFGNLVTMRWWTDLWLNEGFATYMEYIGVDHIEPSWHHMDTFTYQKMSLLRVDSMKHTHAISSVVDDADQIGQKFDDISYGKGSCLIRMLNYTLGEKVFHEGLVSYINKWKYLNAEENDLWSAMFETAKKYNHTLSSNVSIVKYMNSWTQQAGYPLITVMRENEKQEVVMTQKLFSLSPDPLSKMSSQLWQVPISLVSTNSPASFWSSNVTHWVTGPGLTVAMPLQAGQAIYVNVRAIGFYRVNYDAENWKLLRNILATSSKSLPAETRAQLLDDALNIARTGDLDYHVALNMTTYLAKGEDSKIVWDIVLDNLHFLNYNLQLTNFYGKFQDYVRKLVSGELEVRGWGMSPPADHMSLLLIEKLLHWECASESPRCVSWARGQFAAFMAQHNNDTSPIPGYLQNMVYTTALRYGGRAEFEFLWGLFLRSAEPAVRAAIVRTLASTRDVSLLIRLFEYSLTEIPSQYAPMVWSGINNYVAAEQANIFLRENWSRLVKKFGESEPFLYRPVLASAFGFISSDEELKAFKLFVRDNKDSLKKLFQTIHQIVDSAEARIDWRKRFVPTVESWLEQYSNNTKNGSVEKTILHPVFTTQKNVTKDISRTAWTNHNASVTEGKPTKSLNSTEKNKPKEKVTDVDKDFIDLKRKNTTRLE